MSEANRVPFRSIVMFDDDRAVIGVEVDRLICRDKGYKGAEAIVEHARLHAMVPAPRHAAARLRFSRRGGGGSEHP